MAIQSLEAHRVATSSKVGIPRAGVTASKYLPRALMLVWVLCTLALGVVGAGRTLLAARAGLSPASPSPIRSSRGLLIAGASLPVAIRLTGIARWGQTASAMDGGVPDAIAQDRRNGFREGMVQNLRDGVRQLRVLAKGIGDN